MRKIILIVLFCVVCQGVIRCQKSTETVNKNHTNENIFGNVKVDSNNRIKIEPSILESLSTSSQSYLIHDKQLKRKSHREKFDVHYPEFTKNGDKLNIVNSVVLGRVIEELPYENSDSKLDISLNYKVTMNKENFISIVFDGDYNAEGAAHPMNLSFTINYDVKNDMLLSLSDVYSNDSFLELIHGAMKKQLDSNLVDAYDDLKVEEIEEQIYDKYEGFYFKKDKLYVRLTIPSGSQYNGYVSFQYK
ncbi:hypothetical protein lbkm_1457 [Lachnospiraceae bacterium KM106-2]|nr:hypothetical protein lbkm_1457 [Lachnospiraceae bacterium KM106-2]